MRACAGEPPGAVERDVLREEPAPSRGGAVVLAGRDRRTSTRGRTTPGSSSCPASDFADVPVGRDGRADHAGSHRPSVRRARAHPVRGSPRRPTSSRRSIGGLQDGIFEPDSVTPIVRLPERLATSCVRDDLEVERFDLVRPRETMVVFAEPGEGARRPHVVRTPVDRAPVRRPGDRRRVRPGLPAGTPVPASVVVVPVRDTCPIVRAEAGAPVLLVSADADGLVDLAEAGLIDDSVPIRYSASLSGDELERVIADDAFLVVTDTNRKRARRWDNVHDNVGYTERAGEEPLETDTFDNPLDLFPDAPDDAYTVMEQRGVQVSASGYGMQARYVPSDRPARVFDDDLATRMASRRVRSDDRAAHPSRSRAADHHRPGRPGAAPERSARPVDHSSHPPIRGRVRRARGRRRVGRAGPGIADLRRPDDPVPGAHLLALRGRDRRRHRRRAAGVPARELGRVRGDPSARRRAGRGRT